MASSGKNIRVSYRQKIGIQVFTVLVGIALLSAKFTAFFTTHSNAILTDALESIVNVVAGGFGLYSLILASKPSDEDHPYGHGKIEFISASVEGSLVIIAGICIIIKSVYNFFFPSNIEKLDIGIIIVAISGLVNFMIGFVAERRGRKTDSLVLVASGKHLKTDAYTTIGILIGLVLIYTTEKYWLDNTVAILTGLFIMYNGYKIMKESVGGIMDEADFKLINKVVVSLNEQRKENWIDVHNFRIIKYGPHLHIDCHLTVPYYLSVEDSHEEVKGVESAIEGIFPNYLESFIHVDPCIPACCSSCFKQDCPVRKYPFTHKIEWTLENVMQNQKHSLKENNL